MSAVRVVVQHERRLLRDALRHALSGTGGIDVVAAVGMADLPSACLRHQPDLVIGVSDERSEASLHAAVALLRAPRHVPLVLIVDEVDAQKGLDGPHTSMVPSAAGLEGVLDAIASAADRAAGRPAAAAHREPVTSGGGSQNRASGSKPSLSDDEVAILRLVGSGCTTREIARHLDISSKMVEKRKHEIFRKLGVRNQAHAVAVASRRGLIRPMALLATAD